MFINNRELYFETHGDKKGSPVIFLHHGLGSTRAWRGQITDFVNSGYGAIIYDRWGYGRSEPRPRLSVPDFRDDLADLEVILERFGINQVTLIGHSDGGSIALYYAIKRPQMINALVTVAAHIYLEPKMEPGFLGIKQAFQGDSRFREGMRKAHGDQFERTFNNWFDGWHCPEAQEWDMRPLLPIIQCPTLVIQGEEDEHASPQHAVDISRNIPDASLWLISGVKHMVPQEIPGEFNKKVIEFLRNSLKH